MTNIVANYSAHQWFDLDEILEDIEAKLEDIASYEIKWGILYLTMKDGTEHEIESEVETDYKWPYETKVYNDDHEEIDLDDVVTTEYVGEHK